MNCLICMLSISQNHRNVCYHVYFTETQVLEMLIYVYWLILFFIYMFLFVQGLSNGKIHRLEISRKVKSVVYICSTLGHRYVLLLNVVFVSLCNQYVIYDLLFLHRTYYNAAWTFFNSVIVLCLLTYDFILLRNLWTVKCSPH